MTDRQNSKLNMAQRTLEVLRRYEHIFREMPPMIRATETLSEDIASIQRMQTEKVAVNVYAVSLEKQDAEIKMVELCINAINALYVIGFESENKELITLFGISEYSFYQKTNNAALALANQVLNLSSKYKRELSEYRITEATLVEMSRAIENYKRLIVKPMDAVGEKKQKTTNLTRLFAKLDSTLYDKLDKIMVLFKKSNVEFYEEYRTARNIIFQHENKSNKRRNPRNPQEIIDIPAKNVVEGKFENKSTKRRNPRNPKEIIQIPAKNVVEGKFEFTYERKPSDIIFVPEKPRAVETDSRPSIENGRQFPEREVILEEIRDGEFE